MGGVGLLATVVAGFAVPHPLGSGLARTWAWTAVFPLYLVGLLAVIMRPDHPSAGWLGAAGSLLTVETAGRRLPPEPPGDAELAALGGRAALPPTAVLALTALDGGYRLLERVHRVPPGLQGRSLFLAIPARLHSTGPPSWSSTRGGSDVHGQLLLRYPRYSGVQRRTP